MSAKVTGSSRSNRVSQAYCAKAQNNRIADSWKNDAPSAPLCLNGYKTAAMARMSDGARDGSGLT